MNRSRPRKAREEAHIDTDHTPDQRAVLDIAPVRRALDAFDPPADAAVDIQLAHVSAAIVVGRVTHALLDEVSRDPVTVFAKLAEDAARGIEALVDGDGR